MTDVVNRSVEMTDVVNHSVEMTDVGLFSLLSSVEIGGSVFMSNRMH